MPRSRDPAPGPVLFMLYIKVFIASSGNWGPKSAGRENILGGKMCIRHEYVKIIGVFIGLGVGCGWVWGAWVGGGVSALDDLDPPPPFIWGIAFFLKKLCMFSNSGYDIRP